MSKFLVTTKTIMFEEHVVEGDVLSSKFSTDTFGWEGETDTISCEEIKEKGK